MPASRWRTTIAPNLIMPNGLDAIDFYKAAFDAVDMYRVGDDAGVAQLSLGGAEFWIAAERARSSGSWFPLPCPAARS